MPRQLYLVRHGETEANRLRIIQGQNKRWSSSTYGDNLNPTGVKQAVLLGKTLADIDFKFVFTSPAIRAHVTAKIVLSYNNHWTQTFTEETSLRGEDGLLEVDQGLFEGMVVDKIKHKYRKLYNLYHIKPSQFIFPLGESMIVFKKRVGQTIDRILNKDKIFEKNILVVSHAGTITMALIHIFGLNMDKMYHAIRHNNCAFSIIEWPLPSSPPRIECLNNSSHLK